MELLCTVMRALASMTHEDTQKVEHLFKAFVWVVLPWRSSLDPLASVAVRAKMLGFFAALRMTSLIYLVHRLH
jgi:hypothetical protein